MKSTIKSINNFEPWYKNHPYLLAAGILAAVAILVGVSLSLPRHKEVQISPKEQARLDSAALHVALMPVADCLPFYIAEKTGVYNRLGLDIRIHTYQAQLDIDTALANKRVLFAYSDLARVIMLQQDSTNLKVIAAIEGGLDLITARRGRIRQLDQLKEKMVAVSRHSITDYWSDRLTDSAQIERAIIFRPQINNVRIRTDMLCNGTMDAAFLPEPYASEARIRGNKSILNTRSLNPTLTAFVIQDSVLNDQTRKQQVEKLLEGYTIVVDEINKNTAMQDSLRSFLHSVCLAPDSLVNSIYNQLPKLKKPFAAKEADLEVALQWLKGRNQVKKGFSSDSLITTAFIK